MSTVLTFSEVGDHRENEDAFTVLRHPLDPTVLCCFLADGQGGQAGGAPAAQLACRTASEVVSALPVRRLKNQTEWAGVLRKVDSVVAADREAGYSTFVGLCVIGERVIGASSGDSAAILVTESGVVELTQHQQKNPSVAPGFLAVSFELINYNRLPA